MAKAAILEQVGGLTIGEVELADPAPHEVLIDTKACGLCHSDLHFIDGAYVGELVEATGEVIRAGRSLIFVRGQINAGERVLMTFSGVIRKFRPRD